jgi:hypothetical protein
MRERRAVMSGEVDSLLAQWCRFKNDERLVCSFGGHVYFDGRPFWTTRLAGINVDGSRSKVRVQDGRAGKSQLQDEILHWLPNDPQGVLIQLSEEALLFPVSIGWMLCPGA